MSKYFCIKCSKPATVTEFTKDFAITAVYVSCKSCKREAWGGIDFHPAMNEVFNLKFSPNYDYNKSEDAFCRVVELDF
ncbi:MAG: hypothetical protein WBA54_14925 [Acidaminobacteraceae bacterium]